MNHKFPVKYNENKLGGKFIALDGPDGCGKTTQTRLLVDWLKKQDVAVETFREPGGTAIGEKVRQILLNPEHIAMTTAAEVMLYMAARVQLWQEKISPALKENKCVVVDRWLSSTCAYQGYAGGFGMDKVIKIATECIERPWPDLTIILDVDLETAGKRLKKDLDRMERKGNDYHKKVREGFLKLAKDRKNLVVIDAANDIESVHKQVINIVEKKF
jgi:dTMP kinase